MRTNRLRILRIARKKRGLTVRDFWYCDLELLVKESMLDKSYPKKGRGIGWPFYKLSRRGRKSLIKQEALRNAQA